MHKLKEKLMDALYEYEDKAEKNPNGKLSDMEIEKIHKITDTVKNINKIKLLESEEGGYSEASNWMGEGRMYGNSYEGGSSYRRGRMHAKRDSMGRYSREGGYSENSYGRRDGRDNYSRNNSYDGNSYGGSKDKMLDELEDMMDKADSEKERKAIEQCIKQLESV
jgi:hypothetical protein